VRLQQQQQQQHSRHHHHHRHRHHQTHHSDVSGSWLAQAWAWFKSQRLRRRVQLLHNA
jgi:hypothetical protein